MTGASRYLSTALMALLLSTGAYGFDIHGIKTGMTRAELTAYANERGLDARHFPDGGMMIGKLSESRIDATFAFCGDGMTAYSRGLDFDVDYIPTLNLLLAQYGQPRRVESQRHPWTGPDGGEINSMSMMFYKGNDRVELTLTPQTRDSQGQLKNNRASSVIYATKSPCAKEW